jgi:hypothetical protein
MSTLITDTDAVLTFTGTWSRREMANHIAPAMSREEVDALAGLLSAIGEPATADMWRTAHARTDETQNRRNSVPPVRYVVPVDPMDALQCDSCQ